MRRQQVVQVVVAAQLAALALTAAVKAQLLAPQHQQLAQQILVAVAVVLLLPNPAAFTSHAQAAPASLSSNTQTAYQSAIPAAA
jgi:hypothetical protein